MIADSDRREVARRLRAAKRPSLMFLMDVLGVGGEGVFARLADLIEPGEPKVRCVAEVKVDGEQLEQLVHDAVVELTGIDRDALLTVAETMDQDAFLYSEAASRFIECRNHDAAEICYEAAGEYSDYAKVIREALGVSE